MPSEYQVIDATTILRVADCAHIPADYGNADFIEFKNWERAGGVADPYTPVILPPLVAK